MADSNFKFVKLLLHLDGANDGTTITNMIGPAVTRAGNIVTKTGDLKFGSASAYLDGSGDYLQLAQSNDYAPGDGDFTVELWSKQTNTSSQRTLFDVRSTSNDSGFVVYVATDGVVHFYSSGASQANSGGSITTGQWQHIAVVRASGTVTVYIDGVGGTGVSYSGSLTAAGTLRVGADLAAGNGYLGYIDEVRYTVGNARYTGNFTPPSAAFDNFGNVIHELYRAKTIRSVRPPVFAGGTKINCLSIQTPNPAAKAFGTLSGTITESLVFARYLVTACDAITGERYASQVTVSGSYSLKVPKNRPLMVWCIPALDAVWSANIIAAVDMLIAPANTVATPYVYRCTTAGKAGTSEPTWGTVVNNTTSDGDAVWTCIARLPTPSIQGPLLAT